MGRGCKIGAAAQEHLGDRCTRAGEAGQAWISKPTQNQTAPTWESARSSTDGQGHTSPTRMSQHPSPISSAPRLCSTRLCTVGSSPPLALPVDPGSPQFSPGGVIIRWNCLAFSAASPATGLAPCTPPQLSQMFVGVLFPCWVTSLAVGQPAPALGLGGL